MATMINAPGGAWDIRTEVEFVDASTQPNTITCLAGNEEMLRVGQIGRAHV